MKDVKMFSIGRAVKNRKKLRKSPPVNEKDLEVQEKRQCVSKDVESTKLNSARIMKSKKEKEHIKIGAKKANPLQDLDDIFQSIKSKEEPLVGNNQSNSSNTTSQEQPDREYGLVQSSQRGDRGHFISPNPAVHRFDQATGLPVYKYTALLVGDGGGTALCPFDCNCCF